jgi:DNA-directed RNA polymerase subunit RPC12/RpoP
MKIKCYKCNHEWEYKGKSKNYVTCPDCYRKIRFEKLKLKDKLKIIKAKRILNNFGLGTEYIRDKEAIFEDKIKKAKKGEVIIYDEANLNKIISKQDRTKQTN